MRRYDIVSGIFLILSIIDFALAAPVLVQEKCQASDDVVHIPKDVITGLWERGYEEEYYKRLMGAVEKTIKALTEHFGPASQSSVAHASSSAAPLGSDHGSTSVAQLPAPNPASPIYNPNPLMESSRPSMKGDDIPSSAEYGHGSNRELAGAQAPQPNMNPNKRPWTDPGPNFDGHNNPPKRPALSKESGQAHEYEVVDVYSSGSDSELPKDFDQAHQYQIGHVQQTNPGPSADPDFDRHNWMNVEGSPPLRSAPPGPLSPRPSNAGPSDPGPSSSRRPALPWLRLRPPEASDDEVFQGPSPTQKLTDSELHYGLSSPEPADSQEADLQASTYAGKGKAKQSRRISDTARDVANAAQRESRLQPTERSLASDPGTLVSSTVVLANPHMVSDVIPETK